jgi:hypothetical protein
LIVFYFTINNNRHNRFFQLPPLMVIHHFTGRTWTVGSVDSSTEK